MVFEFARYTEITDLAFELRPDYKNDGYVRFFICPDVLDFWFVRVLEGYNEEYEKEEGTFLIERNKIENEYKGQKLTLAICKKIIAEDSGDGWDVTSCSSMSDVIENLDDGFGILNLKKEAEGEQ